MELLQVHLYQAVRPSHYIEHVKKHEICGFAVLGIDSPIFSPSEAPDSFASQVALVGVTPAAGHVGTGKFCILLEPIAAGAIGQAVVSGVVPAKANVTDESHAFADVADGEADYLASSESGPAAILWKESGTGTKSAIVRLGGSSGAAHIEFGKTVGAFTFGATITLDPCNQDGTDNGRANVAIHLAAALTASENVSCLCPLPP
jgi:ribosomal protein L35AE/L33A